MSGVTNFPATATMTVEQALNSALNMSSVIKEVLVIGWSDTGELIVRSSRMSRRDALWLCEQARLRTLDINGYRDDIG